MINLEQKCCGCLVIIITFNETKIIITLNNYYYDQQRIQVNHVSRIPDVSESCALNLAISKSTLSFVPSTSSTALIPSLKGKL